MNTLEYSEKSAEVNHELNPDHLAEIVTQHAIRLLSDTSSGGQEVSEGDSYSIPGGIRSFLGRLSGTRGHSYRHTAGICAYPIPLTLLTRISEELAHAPPDRDDHYAGRMPREKSTLLAT